MKTRNYVTRMIITFVVTVSSACATGNGATPTSWDSIAAAEAEAERYADVDRQVTLDEQMRVAAEHAVTAEAEPAREAAAVRPLCDPRICNPAGPRW